MENVKNEEPILTFDLVYKVINVLKSKFFLFAIAFIFLIIASNNYAKRLKQHKASQQLIDALSPSRPTHLRDDIVNFALQRMGDKYTAAGKRPEDGFDCSGFTHYVFKKFSIEIPSSSLTQSEFGEKIEINEAQKADLVFFKSPTKDNENIGHVGIVISEHGEKILFIHSSTNRGVVIDSLNNPHYKARYRLARRVIQEYQPTSK